MKNFLTKLIFTFIIPFFLLLGTIEWILRSVPNDYRYKNERFTEICDSVKVISFGSSHGHYGIRPDCMSLPAFNMGMPSQSIKYDHFLFYKYIDMCPNLSYVILPVSYFSLVNELEDGDAWAVVKGYSIYMGYKEHSLNPIYNFELINKEKYLELSKMLGKPITYLTCDSLGWGYVREFGDQKPDCTSLVEEIVKRHSKSIGHSMETNIRRLTDIIQTCAQRDIKVLLLTTPTHESYYTLLEEEHLSHTVNACENLANRFANTTYLNLLKDSSFVYEDFYDPDHLNHQGAAKLTKKLDEVIIELGVGS